ncbi:hypothetical protein HK097_002394, partial [Rhizophlyctis rosea]
MAPANPIAILPFPPATPPLAPPTTSAPPPDAISLLQSVLNNLKTNLENLQAWRATTENKVRQHSTDLKNLTQATENQWKAVLRFVDSSKSSSLPLSFAPTGSDGAIFLSTATTPVNGIDLLTIDNDLTVEDFSPSGTLLQINLKGWCLVKCLLKAPPGATGFTPFHAYMSSPRYEKDIGLLLKYYECIGQNHGRLAYSVPNYGLVAHPSVIATYARYALKEPLQPALLEVLGNQPYCGEDHETTHSTAAEERKLQLDIVTSVVRRFEEWLQGAGMTRIKNTVDRVIRTEVDLIVDKVHHRFGDTIHVLEREMKDLRMALAGGLNKLEPRQDQQECWLEELRHKLGQVDTQLVGFRVELERAKNELERTGGDMKDYVVNSLSANKNDMQLELMAVQKRNLEDLQKLQTLIDERPAQSDSVSEEYKEAMEKKLKAILSDLTKQRQLMEETTGEVKGEMAQLSELIESSEKRVFEKIESEKQTIQTSITTQLSTTRDEIIKSATASASTYTDEIKESLQQHITKNSVLLRECQTLAKDNKVNLTGIEEGLDDRISAGAEKYWMEKREERWVKLTRDLGKLVEVVSSG